MGSISKLVHCRKAARVEVTEHAVIVRGSSDYWREVKTSNLRGQEGNDGRIKGLSKNSLSRLRDAIARTGHTSGDYRVYGSCATIPWGSRRGEEPQKGDPTQADAAEIWRYFTNHLSRLLDTLEVGGIFRVELQERGAGHWHLMLYLPNSLGGRLQELQNLLVKRIQALPPECEVLLTSKWRKKGGRPVFDVGGSGPADLVALAHLHALWLIRAEWIKALLTFRRIRETAAAWAPLALPVGVGGAHDAAPLAPVRSWVWCFDAIPLVGVKSGIAYLASHSTKHKVAQLGWTGKQWGFIGQKWLSKPKPLVLQGWHNLSQRARVRVYRLLRRWIRVNRRLTDWRVVRPFRRLSDDFEVYGGLVVRNTHSLYLFGTPQAVVDRALICAGIDVCQAK